VYSGQWLDGKQHGEGKMYMKTERQTIEGEWKLGNMI
jgi:hypothetical protein